MECLRNDRENNPGYLFTPYQIHHGFKVLDFNKSQENKTLCQIATYPHTDDKGRESIWKGM